MLWLVCWRSWFHFQRGKLADQADHPCLFVSYHSLVRLAERGGARTWTDLIAALREI
jgi:hypothetical protein